MPETAISLPSPASLAWLPPFGTGFRIQTLLLVEDSRHAAEAVRILSRRLGLRLRRAEDLASARRHLRVYLPDVALIDLGLPDGSGLDLIAELAMTRPRLRRLVAVSADPEAGLDAMAAGACTFVAKPFRLPADLPALLGPEAPVEPVSRSPDPVYSRNAGADPMAIRDDLIRAGAALRRDGKAGLDYAAQFVAGIASCAGDLSLQAAAQEARMSRDAGRLIRALAERTEPGQLARSF